MTDVVTDTSLAGTPKSQHERPPSTPPAHSPVRFGTRCAAGPAYLLIGDEDGRAGALHQMEEGKEGRWHLVLRLPAGITTLPRFTAAIASSGEMRYAASLSGLSRTTIVR